MRIKLAALLMMVTAGTAMAQTPAKATAPKTATEMVTDDCARARKLGKDCVINIENEKIEGGTPTGDGTSVHVIKYGNAGSLIRLRRDFIPEIVKTAEDL